MEIKKMGSMIKAFVGGAPFGDVAAMKIDALRGTPSDVKSQLLHLSGETIDTTRDELLKYQKGTLGKAYANHLVENNLERLTISPEVVERLKNNPFAIVFTQTHDLHHVLTGFDTSLAGEVGVAAFDMGQGIGPVSKLTWKIARVMYFLVAPSQFSAIRNNLKLGFEMGLNCSSQSRYKITWLFQFERHAHNLGLMTKMLLRQ
jgi:ubiquinone biosynthesis protein COQ4